MTLFRWFLGLPMAATITAALFFLMAGMIRQQDVDLLPDSPAPDLRITVDPPPEGTEKQRPDRRQLPEAPPPPDYTFERSTAPGGVPAPKPGPVTIEPTPPGQNTAIGPVIRVPPPYPEGCRSRGAEGSVIVEFDVSPEGNVVNVRVIETPDRCFVRPIIKAVSGWKYPPAGPGGMRYGVIERFSFELTD